VSSGRIGPIRGDSSSKISDIISAIDGIAFQASIPALKVQPRSGHQRRQPLHELLEIMRRDGWRVCNVRGSHHVLRHPVKPGRVSVPQPRKNLGPGLVRIVLRQAGLDGQER
jgi:predicted RNA binding protein YcfA (HicA-like mRNA interferase family)